MGLQRVWTVLGPVRGTLLQAVPLGVPAFCRRDDGCGQKVLCWVQQKMLHALPSRTVQPSRQRNGEGRRHPECKILKRTMLDMEGVFAGAEDWFDKAHSDWGAPARQQSWGGGSSQQLDAGERNRRRRRCDGG